LKRKFTEQFADFTGTDKIYTGDTGAFYFDNISAEDVRFKQVVSLEADVQITFSFFLSETMDVFCLAGSAQQAQQSTHLAEGLNPL